MTKQSDLTYFLLTNLRLEDGFLRIDFENRFGFDFVKEYETKIQRFIDSGDLLIDEKSVRLSDKGLMIMDYILLNIL